MFTFGKSGDANSPSKDSSQLRDSVSSHQSVNSPLPSHSRQMSEVITQRPRGVSIGSALGRPSIVANARASAILAPNEMTKNSSVDTGEESDESDCTIPDEEAAQARSGAVLTAEQIDAFNESTKLMIKHDTNVEVNDETQEEIVGWVMKRLCLIPKSENNENESSDSEEESAASIVPISITLYNSTTYDTLNYRDDTTMEVILKKICKTRGYEYKEMSLEMGFKPNIIEVEIDRTVKYYNERKSENVLLMAIAKKSKTYQTYEVKNENGDLILTYQMVDGVPKIMLSTITALLDALNDCTNVVNDSFMDAILLTFRSVTTTEVFFTDLISRFHCRPPDNPTQADIDFYNSFSVPQKQRYPFILNLNSAITIIHWWIEHHYHDFQLSLNFRARLKSFLESLISDPRSPFLYLGKRLLDMAALQNTAYTKMLENYESLSKGSAITSQKEDVLTKYDAALIAQQLALNNYTIFKNIHPIEFLNEIWKKDNTASPSFTHFVNRFDLESYWVNTELILGARNLKERVKYLAKIISIASVYINS